MYALSSNAAGFFLCFFLVKTSLLAAFQGLCHEETMVLGEVPLTGSSFSLTTGHVIPSR